MRHVVVACAFVLAAGLLLDGDLRAGNLEPPGPPGPTMKTIQQVEPRTPISSLPFTIAAPGNYYLTSDLTGVAGQIGINITTSFVTLDLNGFSLIGVPGSSDGIRATNPNDQVRQVVIRNGVIRWWGGSGVSASTAFEVHAEDLRIEGNASFGLIVGEGSIVRNTTSSQNGQTGIYASGEGTVIGCTARDNGSIGIGLNVGSTATDCTALGNNVGFAVGSGARVVHSTARLNVTGFTGMEASSIEECSAYQNSDDGIRVTNRALVRGNVARINAGDGIEATGNANRIEDNESLENQFVGIRVSGTLNLIVKNSANGNPTEYSIAGGNQVGTISTNPATAGPWANFDQ